MEPENPYNFESWAVTRLPGFAPNTKQGADGGVDGRATIGHIPDNWKSKLALSQVKGGKFSLSALRDVVHVTDREKAAMGCYTTLRPVATTASRLEVVNTGKVSIQNVSYPKMQTRSIAEYFDEKLPKLPLMSDPYLDEPCVNPRYGGMTTREMVRKVVLRRDDPMDDSASESEKNERE